MFSNSRPSGLEADAMTTVPRHTGGLFPGLPDGFFSNQISRFRYILEDSGMEKVVTYSGHLEYFTTIGYILLAFVNFVVIRYSFSPLWYIEPRKIWQPWDRCYNHNFLRFSTIFGEKIGVFLKSQCYDQNFA
jgi:hypothetical protein